MALTKIKTGSIADNAVTDAKVADNITAGTAATLATARSINGVSFNGSSAITVTAAAGTLSGNTLASGVTASSLTSVGTLTGLTVAHNNITLQGTGETQLLVNAASGNNAGIRFQENGSNKWTIGNDQSNDSLFFYDFGASATRFSIDSSGNPTFEGDGVRLFVKSADEELVSIGRAGSSGSALDQGYFRMKSAGSNKVAFHTAGDSYITGGSLGIGIASPTTKIHLSDGASTAVIAKFTNDTTGNTINDGSSIGIDGDGDLLIYNVENKEIKFYTNDTQRAVIDNSGSVGINYSTPSSMNDSGNNLVIGSGASGDNTGLTIFSNSDSSGSIHFADGTSGDEAYRGIVAYTHSSDAMRFFTSGTEKMRIASDGSVGIHTTSPNIAGYNSERGVLTISSTDNGSANNYANLELQGHAIANDVTLGDISWFDHTNQNAIVRGGRDSSSTTGFLAFFTNGGSGAVERMRITSGGNIIAGGGAPEGTHSERLGVKCLSRFGIFVSDNMSSGTTTIMRMYDTNATTVVGSITSTSSGTAYNTFSDYRLKENEVLISDGLTRLNQLKPYRFNFKTDTDTTVDGFFAHEVSEVVPEAITGKKDAVDDDNNIVPQGIDQSKLVPLLVKALQEADDKIDALTARIEALEA